jgi:hypothetical protein
MKTKLVPVYFDPGRDDDFDRQVAALNKLLGDRAEILPPVALGKPLPEADAVVFPQLLGEAYRRVEDFKSIRLPILIVTSQFGTLSMWDWEIISYLKSYGISTLAPYNLAQAQAICNALGVKRELKETKFLVYQDNPGDGAQASIFKRFYWWEDECSQRMLNKFGITIVKKSFREVGARAKTIPDAKAAEVWDAWKLPTERLSEKPIQSAIKMYLALKHDLDQDASIRGVGINCLNESHFSDTTPCLAFNMLHTERQMVWGCEADTLSMLTQYLLQHSLESPLMMTNLYPFVLGDAALKHERISNFPDVEHPENHILVAHCGYLGLLPTSYASQWTLRPKVLGIVDDNATAIDGRLPVGDVTLVKLHSTMNEMTVAEGELTGYAQYENSDCRNGGIIRVRDGRKLVNSLCSHHFIVATGHKLADIQLLGKVFDLTITEN